MYYKRQLLDMQKRAELVLQHSPALATTFADRFDMAKNLFAKLHLEWMIMYCVENVIYMIGPQIN